MMRKEITMEALFFDEQEEQTIAEALVMAQDKGMVIEPGIMEWANEIRQSMQPVRRQRKSFSVSHEP